MRSLRGSAIGAVLALGITFVAVPANAALLSDLINTNLPPEQRQIEIGDKLFDNFELTIVGVAPYSADAANIEVTGVDLGGTYGLKFTAVSPVAPMILANAAGYVDLLIGFDAKVTDPAFKISEVNLSFVAAAPSDGLAQIVESAYLGSNPAPVQIQVSTLGSDTASASLPDTYSSIRVYKDISVIGGSEGSSSIDEFEQLFIQVPEPGAIAFLAIGAMAFFRRRAFRRRTILAMAVVMALAGLLTHPGTASAVPLSSLDDMNNSVSFGQFEFSNFDFDVVGSNGKWIADTAAIDVQGFTTPDGSEDGLRFVGLIAALSNVEPSSSVTITIDYDVAAKPGTPAIHDVSMSFNGAVIGPDGKAQVGKSVLNEAGASIGEIMVWNEPAAAQPLKLYDHADLVNGPYMTIHVHDRIIVDGGEAGATTISFINQTFSVVPEPTAALMGLLGLPMLVRRRRAR